MLAKLANLFCSSRHFRSDVVQNSQTLQGYIFRILQHFVTEPALLLKF